MKTQAQSPGRNRAARLRPAYLEFSIRVYPSLGYQVEVRKPYQVKDRGRKT